MRKLLLFTTIFSITLTGCVKFTEPETIQRPENETGKLLTRSTNASGFDSLPDPYALEVMQAVYDSLIGNITLQATDLYVRFMPQDSTQIELLEDLYDLALFDYPLDLDIPENEEYVDPTIPEGGFTWQYTVVNADFDFPEEFDYEIIRECYIPEDDAIIPGSATRAGEDVYLERAAFEMLGYDLGPETRSGGGGFHAQDVMQVLPNSVTVTEDDRYLVNYISMIPILVGAIQEQNAQIEALKAEVAALKNK